MNEQPGAFLGRPHRVVSSSPWSVPFEEGLRILRWLLCGLSTEEVRCPTTGSVRWCTARLDKELERQRAVPGARVDVLALESPVDAGTVRPARGDTLD